jgi:hypothetical protein
MIPKRIADRLKWDGKSTLRANCPEREEKRPPQTRKLEGQAELF